MIKFIQKGEIFITNKNINISYTKNNLNKKLFFDLIKKYKNLKFSILRENCFKYNLNPKNIHKRRNKIFLNEYYFNNNYYKNKKYLLKRINLLSNNKKLIIKNNKKINNLLAEDSKKIFEKNKCLMKKIFYKSLNNLK